MITRRILRLALVVVALALGAVIWWQWRPEEAVDASPVELELPKEREVASRSERLEVTQSANGELVFQLGAAEQLDFVDGWNIYDDVVVRIPTADADAEIGEDDATEVPAGPCGADGCIRIRADTLRASGRVPNFDELRFIGNVIVDMPGGLHFETRRLDYDPVTGVVSNCNRNELRYSELDVRADCLRFETGGDVARDRALRARELEMWGDLLVQTSPEAQSLPPGLRGNAERMRFEPESGEVSLTGEPELVLARARVAGTEVFLTLADGAQRLEQVRAVGDGRLDWSPPESSTDVAGADAGVDEGAPRERQELSVPAAAARPEAEADAGPPRGESSPARQRLSGGLVVLELAPEGGSENVLAQAGDGGPATLDVEGAGHLEAREIAVVGAAGEARISATGQAVWRSRVADAPVPRLSAATLVLGLAGGRLRSLRASGQVRAAVAVDDAAAREFEGGRLELAWDETGELTDGGWPEGVTFGDGERVLRAARAERIADEPGWRLDGTPRPGVRDALFQLEADELRVLDSGDLEAEGEVAGEIDAGSFGAGAALFGDVERVRVQSEGAVLGGEGDLRLTGAVRVLWREQSLVAGRLLVMGDPGRLQASRDVELVVAAGEPPAGDDRGAGEGEPAADPGAGLLIAMAEALLVDGDPAEIRLAGDASVQIGDRRITSERVVISPGPEGGWRRFLAEESVEFEAPLGKGSGVSLDYDLDRQELILEGDETTPAEFELADDAGEEPRGPGVSPRYESTGALRIRWLEETVEIAAIEDGRTRTSVVPREQ